MTKKEFKELCSDHTYTGWNGHKNRINAFFYDFKQGVTPEGKYFGGYKYRITGNVKDITKKELFNVFYNHVINGLPILDWLVDYRVAETDEDRRKVPLSLKD